MARAVAEAVGAGRVGIRISPANGAGGTDETDAADVAATYGELVDGLAPLGLAYLHVLGDPRSDLTRDLRARFGGVFMANTGFAEVTSRDEAADLVSAGDADLDPADAKYRGRAAPGRRRRCGATSAMNPAGNAASSPNFCGSMACPARAPISVPRFQNR